MNAKLAIAAFALGCGAPAPRARTVTVAPVASSVQPARVDAPRAPAIVLAFETSIDAGASYVLDRGRLIVAENCNAKAFDAHVPVAAGDALVGVGDDLFDAATLERRTPTLAKKLQCEDHGRAFSADGARMSVTCTNASGDSVVVVIDTRSSAEIGTFAEFHTAAPIRAGTITASGNFVFWVARASGAFEEIKSHVTGPIMSSHSVMSCDERMLFTVPDRNWLTEDRTPATILDPKNGRALVTLGDDVVTAFFSRGSVFAVRHSKQWGNMTASIDHDVSWIEVYDGARALGRVPGDDASDAVLASDGSSIAVRYVSEALRVFAVRR